MYSSFKNNFKKFLSFSSNPGMDSDATNLLRARQRLANEETAKYIEENLPLAKPFKNNFELLKFAIDSVTIKGMYCEFGVFEGETINFIADSINGMTVYGFDWFKGLPEDWKYDMLKGTFKMNGMPQVRSNVVLISGLFEETFGNFVNEKKEQCAFIHVDCDLYSSTKTVFKFFKDKIKPGTIIVFDEYFNYPGWKNGEFKAFQEFISDEQMSYEYIGFCYLWRQAAVRINKKSGT
jgi:hypothetical protein